MEEREDVLWLWITLLIYVMLMYLRKRYMDIKSYCIIKPLSIVFKCNLWFRENGAPSLHCIRFMAVELTDH